MVFKHQIHGLLHFRDMKVEGTLDHLIQLTHFKDQETVVTKGPERLSNLPTVIQAVGASGFEAQSSHSKVVH